MTPEYVLLKSLCRGPHCVGKYESTHGGHIKFAMDEISNIQFAWDYAEKGYDKPKKFILFANWNYFPRGIDSILEGYGYAIEWSDEWTTCEDCNRAVRTSPDCYQWQPSYVELDGSIACLDCVKDSSEDYLSTLEDNPRTALNTDIDPSQFGYTQIKDGYESGLHPHMTDDPKKIYTDLRQKGYSRILFKIDEVSQFYTTFSVWQKEEI